MSNELLQAKLEVLGVFFLVKKIRDRYEDYFAISKEEACKQIESETQEKDPDRSVSMSSFKRILNFELKPIISFGQMNNLTHWFTDGNFKTFHKYITKHEEAILEHNNMSDDKVQLLLNKIKNHRSKTKTSILSKDKRRTNSVEISGIESGKDTKITIKGEKSNISIGQIKSGDNTSLDL
ncbi:hypothetical protein [Flavivirga jejuensis]|uniref:Uncharacterized protein n=1 Tax=Flavivirga jejuensis TaxID=870487 RepID=A0ABT8WVL4_9FLAO|nr:hypothetical protein [Flavivirga jejuensis]MDO5976917.1 hypothetical protein [Flavivirga jejuensis]